MPKTAVPDQPGLEQVIPPLPEKSPDPESVQDPNTSGPPDPEVDSGNRKLARKEAAARRKANNPLLPGGFLGQVFDFLASLELAVFLLLILGLVCVAGTVYESNYTARLAKRLVYRTAWFDFLLASIFVNVVFATLSRYPWRLTQLGWLITHLGVLAILVGGVVTHRYGIEGNMMLVEGRSGDSISLPISHIKIQKTGDSVRYKFETTEVEWGHPEEDPQTYEIPELGLKVIVDNFYPDSEFGEEWRNDGTVHNPAVEYAIESSFAGTMAEGWLAPRVPGHRSFDLGPARILAKEITDEEALKEELQPRERETDEGKGWLEVVLESGERLRIPVEEALEKRVPLKGTEYALQITTHMDYAYLNQDQELVDAPGRAPNPMVIYDVYRGDEKVAEREMKFSRIPDFESMHGKKADLPFKVSYHRHIGDHGKAEFAILIGPDDELRWKVETSGGEVSSGTLEVGEPVPMAMMTAGMSLVIRNYYPNAVKETKLLNKPIKKGDFRNKAAHLKIVDSAGNEATFWQRFTDQKRIKLADDVYLVSYEPQRVPLGFSIMLKDFRLKTYPGSSRPMSYESDVRVVGHDKNGTITRDVTIMMNEPMDHNGFRVFQSSYINEPPGDPQISIFSIAYDPGVPIIYFGSIILCIGIAIMFWGKPYLRKLENRLKVPA